MPGAPLASHLGTNDIRHYCNNIGAPWLVNGGHGASIKAHTHLIDLGRAELLVARRPERPGTQMNRIVGKMPVTVSVIIMTTPRAAPGGTNAHANVG